MEVMSNKSMHIAGLLKMGFFYTKRMASGRHSAPGRCREPRSAGRGGNSLWGPFCWRRARPLHQPEGSRQHRPVRKIPLIWEQR